MTPGIQIKTEGENKNHDTSGFKLNYYESRLDLFEITRDTHTTFQCKANKYKDAVTKSISFRIKGKTSGLAFIVSMTCKRETDSPCTDKLHSKPPSRGLDEKGTEMTSFVATSVTLAIFFLFAITIVGVKQHYDKVHTRWTEQLIATISNSWYFINITEKCDRNTRSEETPERKFERNQS